MSNGETAFLAMVLCAFATFIVVVGFVSVWSRRPSRSDDVTGQASEPVSNPRRQLKTKRELPDSIGASSDRSRTSQAA